MDAVRVLFSRIRAFSHATEARHGISGAQLFVLQQLATGQSLSINELAAATRTHQSSVSVVVSRLKERGLCTTRPAEEDRRRVEVSITPRGRSVVAREPSPLQVQLITALGTLPTERRQALAVGLQEWLEKADLAEDAPPMFFEEHAPPGPAPARRRRS
ncbi:MAG: winged helix-turn-helix transcriptional regulator [Deltaproteobacteria bacterium]|nr:winged helix-turn-helix transcriptional regulator [Deltaproteobacteria bacterium]